MSKQIKATPAITSQHYKVTKKRYYQYPRTPENIYETCIYRTLNQGDPRNLGSLRISIQLQGLTATIYRKHQIN